MTNPKREARKHAHPNSADGCRTQTQAFTHGSPWKPGQAGTRVFTQVWECFCKFLHLWLCTCACMCLHTCYVYSRVCHAQTFVCFNT